MPKWLRIYLVFLFLIASSGAMILGWAWLCTWLYGMPDQLWPDLVIGVLILVHVGIPWMWGTIKIIEKVVPELA